MPKETTINDKYFSWLYQLIGQQRRPYKKLCKELHKKPYRWTVPNDDNRAEDGLNLRDQFIEENELDIDHLEVRYFLKNACSVFEMLVALSQRINELTFDLNTQQDNSSKWFLELIKNLRLDHLTDGEIFYKYTEEIIDTVLETFLSRTYDSYGRGGLFPMKGSPPRDMSKVEIWYQVMLYLEENRL